MPFQEKRLVNPTVLTTSASSALYTVPTGYTAIIKQLVVTNTTASPRTFTIYIGATAVAGNALFSGTAIAASDALVINLSQVLTSTEKIFALSDAGSALNLTISGVENNGPLEAVATYIADNAVTTAKIADASVTTEKIAAGAIIDIDVNASAAIAPTKIAGTSVVKTDYTAKGVALIGSGVSTPTALTVGTNGQLLTANSATATGLEWQTNTSGLVLVAEQTIGNSVTQQNVSNVFTSTYTNYRIIMTGGAGSATAGVFLRLDNVATGYYQGTLSTRYDNVGGAGGGGRNNVDTFQIGRSWTDMISLQCELLGPQLAKPTTIQGQWNDTRVIAGTGVSMYSGVQTSTTSFTGFTIFFDGGTTFTGGVIAVYGYRKTL